MAVEMQYVVERGIRWLREEEWQPVMQRAIDAFYEGKIAEGAEACRTLLNAHGVPANIRNLTYQNQTWYAQPLAELAPEATWRILEAPAPNGWTAQDPSPVAVGASLTVVLRASEGVNGDEGERGEGAPGPIREPVEGMELVVVPGVDAAGRRWTQLRPFLWEDSEGGKLHVAMVTHGPGEEPARAGVAPVTAEGLGEATLFGPRAGHFRQGWSPAATAEGPRFVSWWEPTEVFRPAEPGAEAEFELTAQRMAPHIAERFAGGSAGAAVPGGWFFLVNEAATMGDGNEVSLSRFVRLDNEFRITAISPQFWVEDRGQDVATGLARQGEQLIAGFRSGTRPLLATLGVESVQRMLIPVAAPGRPFDTV